MYNAVGIDASKGKSTVTVLQPGGKVIRKPFDVSHYLSELKRLADYIFSLDGDTKVVMESTARYHEPLLRTLSDQGIFVSVVNAHLIKISGTTPSGKSSPILRTPERSPGIRWTTGRTCDSIPVWILHVNN